MGAVSTSAARAPLTSLASVVEMTGDFSLTLPVMLAVAIASTVSRALSYGTICTSKLLRRGTDIDKTTPGILRTPTGTPGNRQTSNPPPSHRQGPASHPCQDARDGEQPPRPAISAAAHCPMLHDPWLPELLVCCEAWRQPAGIGRDVFGAPGAQGACLRLARRSRGV